MSNEIELKFAINRVDIPPLTDYLMQFATPQQLTLSNTYYDRPDSYLRQQGYGLRVRKTHLNQCDHYEITVKSKGRSIAGLHERAEFNSDLPNAIPNLAYLPKNAFPKKCDLPKLQETIIPLFQTDFHRQTWLINVANSQIEVALDQGEIHAAGRCTIIQELELELKEGTKRDLINFAQQLCQFHLRLFSQSKASRGYRLLKGDLSRRQKKISDNPSTLSSLNAQQQLSELLQYWQQNEEQAIEDRDLPHYLATLKTIAEHIPNLIMQDDFDNNLIRSLSELTLSEPLNELAEKTTELKLQLMAHL